MIEGFGRALHGVQDFYSHSNCADERDPARPAGVNNPPGLATGGAAAVMSLRAAGPAAGGDLSTGCFVLIGSGCRGRVTHDTLNKDNGIIDPVSGAATGPTTTRGGSARTSPARSRARSPTRAASGATCRPRSSPPTAPAAAT